MDHIVYPGRDPLGPLEFWSKATRITFEIKFIEGTNWQGTRHQLNRAFESYFTGMFDVLLGDESKVQDDSAEFVLYVEAEEAEKALAVIEHIGKTYG